MNSQKSNFLVSDALILAKLFLLISIGLHVELCVDCVLSCIEKRSWVAKKKYVFCYFIIALDYDLCGLWCSCSEPCVNYDVLALICVWIVCSCYVMVVDHNWSFVCVHVEFYVWIM